MPRSVLLALSLALSACATSSTTAPSARDAASANAARTSKPPKAIAWQRWTAETFARAKKERKIVVVAIETQWCHWCHVMDDETWSDPALQQLIDERYVAIREDADARPDLAERYADWGWPALAVLSPDAEPVTELRGFQEKTKFAALLRSFADKLDRGEKLARVSASSQSEKAKPSARDAVEQLARKQLDDTYDDAIGGWGKGQKYPFYAPVEEALLRGFLTGDETIQKRGLRTLLMESELIDYVDGGMFQYSLDNSWDHPHYEKLAVINGDALGSYAKAYAATNDEGYRTLGNAIALYVRTMLLDSSGAFYANQDADTPKLLGHDYYALGLVARRHETPPAIDKHIYASHNGRIIAGLARFASATWNDELLKAAVGAADAIEKECRVDGVFAHQKDSTTGAHLADQVAMGLAYNELYEATGDMKWREKARDVAKSLAKFHDDKAGGFFEHPPDAQFDLDARKPIKQNAEAARFLLKIGRLDANDEWIQWANGALDVFSNQAAVEDEGRTIGEYLLALEEARAEPLHFAIVSAVDDDATRALYRAALDVYAPHRLVERVQPGAKYPDLGTPALYLCGAGFCSPPITAPSLVATKAKPFLKPRT